MLLSTRYSLSTFPTLAVNLTTTILVAATAIFLAVACLGQDQPQPPSTSAPQSGTQPQAPPPSSTVTLPSGTRIALVLTHDIQSRTLRRGDPIYAQISFPVNSGNEVVIPPGTFVQGTLDKLERKSGRAEMRLQSMTLTLPDGYVSSLPGPVRVVSDEGYAIPDLSKGRIVGMIALPAAGAGLGAAIGHAAGGSGTNINGMNFNPGGLQSTAIGSMVGLAAGGVGSLVLLRGSRNFFLGQGAPVEITLQQPLSLQRVQATGTESQPQQVAIQPIAPRPAPPENHGTCLTPGTPGTPSTTIPGAPGPNGVPGPPITIPGTPPTPGTPYPCP
ncbi:MAG TPA: hypothetical protein VFL34_09565 [Candidatus Sulfotelmatobacter sp.]|nr:hypothetical protein [Candidatus Sulfotelmatobacter sp.]